MLTALHVWDHRTANAERDLHWALARHGVDSRQCIRELEMQAEEPMPGTVAMHQVHADAPPPGWLARLRARAWRLDWIPFARLIEQQIRIVRPDVLHAHFGTTGWKVSALAERYRLPLVVSFYGVDVSQVIRQSRWQRRYRQLFARAARLVVLCDAAADRLVDLGCPRAKIRIWNHPLDLAAYEFRAHRPRTPARLLIGARFVEKKGHPFLLRACARLRREGREITLTAVGYGSGQRRVREYAAELGLGDRFQLIDSSGVANFDRFYNRILGEHDIFVLPSTTARSGDDEGGPALSLVLAQAAGLPVVCTRFAGAERSVVDGVSGRFCEQDDAESLAARIGELIDDPEAAAAMAARANALVRGAFDLTTQAAAMTAIYREASDPISLSKETERCPGRS